MSVYGQKLCKYIVTIITTITDKQLGDVGVGLLCSVLVPDSKCVETVLLLVTEAIFLLEILEKNYKLQEKILLVLRYTCIFRWFSGHQTENSPVRVFKRWSR